MPMGAIEKYFGIKEVKKLSDSKLSHRSKKYLAKLEEDQILKNVNELYAKGHTDQCFALLEKAVRLVPNDPRPFYLLGLIHEENQRYEKASISYVTAAILQKSDLGMWKKALSTSLLTDDDHRKILALERLYRREPNEAILLKKMEILRRMRKKYSKIACQIELFDYNGVDPCIFDKFEKTKHINSLQKICSKLYKCIKNNTDAQTEYFISQTISNLYKIKDWKRIIKLLDDFYFRNCDTISPEIRFIYIIAAMNVKEFRYDPLLAFDNLINDVSVWKELRNDDYVYDLAESMREKGDLDKSIELIDTLTKFRRSLRATCKIGDYHLENGSVSTAVKFYHQIISEDPINEDAKSRLYSIYKEMGDEEMAKQFEVSTKVQEYINSVEDTVKEDYRFPPDKCIQMKKLYESSKRILDEDIQSYSDFVQPLIDDFFSNPFVVIKNKNFRSFSNKNEKIDVGPHNELVPFDEGLSRRQMSMKLVRISSLHGLDVDEWFSVLKNTIFSLISQDMVQKAIELIENGLEAYIFKPSEYLIELFFLSIRMYLMVENFDKIVDVIKRMIYAYDYSAIYLLYALAHLFPDFHLSRNFCKLQRNVQRLAKHSHKPWTGVSTPLDVYTNTNEFLKGKIEDSITEYMGISSFLPRFLQTVTVDFIKEYKKSEREEINTMAGIVFITHTKSRSLPEKKEYATIGINFIKQISSESSYKLYNLAKAYHFFGFYGHAENLYLQVIEKGPESLKRMSVFNLSLIFKMNKSRKVLDRLLSRL